MPDPSQRARPDFTEIDAFGLTHVGKVRETNQDHFFIGALARGVTVEGTSFGAAPGSIIHPERLASLAVVADGVGSSSDGEEAARVAVTELVRSTSKFFHEAQFVEAADPDVFSRLLQDAALGCHESLLRRSEEEGGERSFSTTLTLFLGLWPHAYLLQVGDSRCYMYQNDELTLITRDQTWAQELVDNGTLSQTQAEKTKWAHVLSSAIGGDQATPVVTRITRGWGAVVLLCSDGLTNHVTDEQIEARIRTMTDARQVAEQLVQDALDAGGTDNVTIIVGRTRDVTPGGRTP